METISDSHHSSTPIRLGNDAEANSTTHKLIKRQPLPQRRIDTCPRDAPPGTPAEWQYFYQSKCIDATRYTIECGRVDEDAIGGTWQTFIYECGPNEFCMNGGSDQTGKGVWGWTVALCVGHDEIIELAHEAVDAADERTMNLNPAAGAVNAPALARQEVLLTSQAGSLYVADQISLQAQNAAGQPLGPAKSCQSCGRMDYNPWPQGTDKFVGHVKVANANDEPWAKAVSFHHEL
ncbi:uncharacterized protein KY384_006746 [Bacidia gigantensis]|uniref:uncharacterized protein n=1 Tax=Bacidia gigantensis TaxID=2732470 RepID=UPI001D04A09F|nr:uncharacterized protein KY384_006746 [Bacidia gigantensis]KAG8527830.1 hypothetical protein KY384_006746 [Bacidia gigantensis]